MLPKVYPVTCNTKFVGQGSTFVAIKGFKEDGNNYIKKAIELGAKKIVTQEDNYLIKQLCKDKKIDYVLVKDSRKSLAQLSINALKNNSLKCKIIGITGTKGKTTTSYIVEHILRNLGFKTALLGTIKNKILDQEFDSLNTTPQSDYLQVFLAECEKKNVDFVVMEVSSHALSLERVYGIEFDAVGFTNLAPEHLDFYKDMESYFQAKSLIFNQLKKSGTAVVNTDDKWGQKIKTTWEFKNKNFIPITEKSFYTFSNTKQNLFLGKFNLYNLMMAFLICRSFGLKDDKINQVIKSFSGVPGRMQKHILKNGSKAFVDYAHNASSMEAVLKTLRPLTKDLIVVFGCGGDRDKTKRPVMGSLAYKYADKIFITDDNPRFEDPVKIAEEILTGIPKSHRNKVIYCSDRKEAIRRAASLTEKKSILAVLGKGHEKYHIVKDKKFHLDDFEEVSYF